MDILITINDLPERIRHLREKHGFKTQQAFADALHVDRSLVKGWERKSKPTLPRLDNLLAICELFHCDLDHLVGTIQERTHDNKTVCELTGLSEAAIEKIQKWNHPGSMFRPTLSKLIESDYFEGLIAAFTAFTILCKDYSHLEESKTPISFLQEIEDDKVVMPANEALYHYMHKAEMEMQNICELYRREEREKKK